MIEHASFVGASCITTYLLGILLLAGLLTEIRSIYPPANPLTYYTSTFSGSTLICKSLNMCETDLSFGIMLKMSHRF